MTKKTDSHDIISEIKRIASKLNRTPQRDEFIEQSCVSINQVRVHFKTYSAALIAAGLDAPRKLKEPKPNPIEMFKKNLADVLSVHKEKKKEPQKEWIFKRDNNEWILAIGDVHSPFVDFDALTAVVAIAERYKAKIKYCIFLGDVFDMLAKSRFPRSINHYTPKQEMQLGREILEGFIKSLQAVLRPDCEFIMLLGNHDIRPMRLVIEKAPELEGFVEQAFRDLFTFSGVKTNYDYRQEVQIGDTLFHHGYLSNLGAHRDYNLMNTVAGHSHVGGCVFRNVRALDGSERVIYEANAGYIADPKSKALGYVPQKLVRWTKGVLLIDDLGPRFMPF